MKPLATNNILNALFFPVAVFVMLLILTIAGGSTILLGVPLTVLLFAVLGIWIYIDASGTYNVFYDDEFIYLKGLLHRCKVPHSQVRSIARDQTGMKVSGVTAWRYRLEFTAITNVAGQTFYEVDGGTKVAEFVKHIRNVNPGAAVE